MYDLAALEAALKGSIFARNVHYFNSTGSTNTNAMEAAGAGAANGSVYLADEQTAGRGRGDHQWESAAGQGLYVSVLLRLGLPVAHLSVVPLAAGLAAANAIATATALKIDLRWPNDLLIGRRKVGGILVESRTERGELAFVVIGIGINVHQRDFSPALSTPATSLDIETGRAISRQSLLIALLESLQRETSMLHDPAVVAVTPSLFALHSTWLWNREVEVHGPQACTGITDGLDEHGFLRVRTAQGLVIVQTGGIRAAETA
ncbi:MAG TPA: biotin--[acetyl-CoA-carboxylase] ligase [Terracidiphilus sp.]|nr:biotin--[acetyl-CoA-carboxylase] ligase [Terracidiphilus sp.]